LLAAIKTAGLTDMLVTGGPYLVLAPTDEAFAALPKETRDALLDESANGANNTSPPLSRRNATKSS